MHNNCQSEHPSFFGTLTNVALSDNAIELIHQNYLMRASGNLFDAKQQDFLIQVLQMQTF